jgi:hypothetical protein
MRYPFNCGLQIAEFSPEGLSSVTQGFSPDDSEIRIPNSALKKVSPHTHIQEKADSDQSGEEEGPAITEQGKRNSYHRHQA